MRVAFLVLWPVVKIGDRGSANGAAGRRKRDGGAV